MSFNNFGPAPSYLDMLNYGGLGAYQPAAMDVSPLLANGASMTSNASQAVAGDWWNGDFMKSMIGTQGAPGWGGMALGAAQGLMGGYLGLQQLGIAKDTLAENKRQFQMNWNAQKQTTNTALEDRQRARVASNPGAYQSVGAYMKDNGVA